jgi:hypothetical protein
MKKSFIVAGILAWVMWQAPAPVWAEDTKTEHTKELERRIDMLSEEMDAFGFRKGDDSPDRVKVHGYGELHFNMPTDGSGDSQFDNHRFVLGVEARLADWIFLNAEIDFEHAAQELEFEFGYLDFLIKDGINVRAGVMLVPMGFLNEFHEPPLFWTVERPQFHTAIIPTTWNASGAGIFGTPTDGVSYRLYVTNALQSIRPGGSGPVPGGCNAGSGNGAGGNCGFFRGSDGIRKGRLQPNKGIFEDFAVAGRIELTKLLPGLHTGFSFHTGNTTQNLIPEGGRATMLEADMKYRYQWFDMNASIAHINISDAAAINTYQLAQVNPDPGDVASGIFGWNIQAGIHMPQLLNMSTSQDVIPFILYEFIDTQNQMPVGFAGDPKNRRKITTAGISYLPIPAVALKFDYQHTSQGDGNRIDQVNLGMAYMF